MAGPPPETGDAGAARAGGEPLLEIRDLAVVRGTRSVLAIDRLDVRAGETLSVVGPNGAGKSTLLLAVARLLPWRSGAVRFQGTLLTRANELAYRRRIGMVLSDPLLLGTSVFANVAAGLRFRGVPGGEIRTRVTEWLERLRVAHLVDRPARHISSGEAQRVSLARALVLEPDLLLLDEPFASVDVAVRAQLLDDLEALLAEAEVTCIMVTHDLDEAVRLGDRMAVLVEGRAAQCDEPERVLAAPVDERVAAFVGVETRIPGRVTGLHDGLLVVEAAGTLIEAVAPPGAPGSVAPARHVLCCLRPEDITIVAGEPADDAPAAGPRSSARNRVAGPITRLVVEGPLVRVSVGGACPISALITRLSAQEMGLVEGLPVVATFKASAVHLIPRTG
ncbi:MAG: ABC transporter ATP-binding protein [Chloroflexi bacterium]|nr:ABC transporter ATP-binding protein [Chloroflexota bacterium]